MIERIFVGWKRPALPEAARILQERYAWDMGGVLVVVPGGQAARRLERILHDAATAAGCRKRTLPEIMTPADLMERCCRTAGKIATPTEAHFAWMQAAKGLDGGDRRRLAPKICADTEGPMAWAGVAAQARELRNAVAAEGLTISDAAGKFREWAGFRADHRWEALARLERGYVDALAAVGLGDRDDARRTAPAAGAVSCDRDVYLVGAQDLNGLERAILRSLSSPVCAVIPAPEEERDGFDEVGCLCVASWHDRDVPIPDDRLYFVDGPADEANQIGDLIAALDRRYAREEITVGVGDEAAAEGLGLRLAAAGLPTFSPYGRSVGRTRPAALLTAIRDYLSAPSARNFAALVRHPDLEQWLEARLAEKAQQSSYPRRQAADPSLGGKGEESRLSASPLSASPLPFLGEGLGVRASFLSDSPFLSLLDLFRAECLPEDLSSRRSKAEDSPATVCAAREAVESLLAPLRGEKRRMPHWAEPITDVLRAVYADEPLDDTTPEGRQFARSLERLASLLTGMKRLPLALAPEVSGPEALAFVLAEAEPYRLPSDNAEAGLEMMGWLELALDDAPVLLLTGLHEGCVPKNTGDDPLLPDSLRARLGLADDRRRQARDGLLLRVMLESRADVRLIVARRGSDGAPKMPSRLLFACDAVTAAGRARRFAAKESAGPTRALFAPGTGRRLAPPEPPKDGLHALRVTAFRDYLACPYRFYLRHVLKLDAPDDSQEEMDARLFGILVHDCLDGFAHSEASDSADPERIRTSLRAELQRQCERRFGPTLTRPLQLQARQAGRRLDAFADWQAQSVRDGWRIEPDLAEVEMTALLVVDDQDFVITGRLDRVDYCPNRGFRIIDYKTGDSGKGPDERHRPRTGGETEPRWADLQLPLYRRLLEAQGKPVAPGEMGYVLLSSDLASVTLDARGRWKGGTGFVRAPWTEDDHASALRCAEDVVRRLRAGVFWPPADPLPFPPSRTDPGRADPYSGLCLDSCSDRADWLGLRKTII